MSQVQNPADRKLLRLRLTGGDAELGRIPARDVAELLLGAERVFARAAGHVRGRELRKTGRWGVAVEKAVRLRFAGIEGGSFTAVLSLPEPAATPLGLDAETLTEAAIRDAISLVGVAGREQHRDVASAIVKWADTLGIGEKYQSVHIAHDFPELPSVNIDRATTERLRSVARIPPVLRENELIGRLVEADFERRTAHLRTGTGDRVEVTFQPEWDDEIQQALRLETSVVGDVIYDASTQRAVAIHLRQLTRGEQLTAGLEPGDFAATLSISELARRSGIHAVKDPATLRLRGLTTAEIDAFMSAVGDGS